MNQIFRLDNHVLIFWRCLNFIVSLLFWGCIDFKGHILYQRCSHKRAWCSTTLNILSDISNVKETSKKSGDTALLAMHTGSGNCWNPRLLGTPNKFPWISLLYKESFYEQRLWKRKKIMVKIAAHYSHCQSST